MLFSARPRARYRKAPVHEVICQLRFPTILSINNVEPADFQEAIREDFPQYARREDATPPKIAGINGTNLTVQQTPAVTNYHFLSADGAWKLNLTKDFIALSTLRYPDWETFAHHLDRPLTEFIRLYKPAYFQRLGLRYVNIISRQQLGLEDVRWVKLISPAYVGPLNERDSIEGDFLNFSNDIQLRLGSTCQAKIHSGLGKVRQNRPDAPADDETKFIFDLDLSMLGDTPCSLAAAGLETIHGHADRIFEGAITDWLRNAMEPID